MAEKTKSAKIIKACIDVAPPIDQQAKAAQMAIEERPDNAPALPRGSLPLGFGAPTPMQLAALTGKLWKPGRALKVRFLDGDASIQEKLQPFAHIWEQFANINFIFDNDPKAEIRISFKLAGSWSYIGTDCLTIAANQPTMNFGWLTKATAADEYSRVVTHEFGHAIGCIHEHQNPATNIPWDKEKVYKYYQGPPNNWTRDQVDVNLFTRYGADITQFSDFDKNSIMLYPVPNDFTIGDFEVGWNKALSDTDKKFISTLYPMAQKPTNELTLDAPAISASIGQANEIDTYTFTIAKEAKYRLETEGQLDMVMNLFGPNDATKFVAQDDDSGAQLNARIVTVLKPGSYTIRLRHFSNARTGDYKIGVYTAV
jgi:hypothetical protein